MSLLVEMYVDGAWTDITSDVYTRDSVTITHGQSDEGSSAAPAQLNLTLNNRDGQYSPRNPLSPYYGKIGRNTGIRAGISSVALKMTGLGYASTPDSAGLSVVGDIDIRVDVSVDAPSSWHGIALASKWGAAGNMSWYLQTTELGRLHFVWTENGTDEFDALSTVAIPGPLTGRKAVRVTLDVDDGGANTTTFYTADTIDGPWEMLGNPVSYIGVTSIFNSTATTNIGMATPGVTGLFSLFGAAFAAEIRNGIDGALVASPDFTTQTAGASAFTDAQGNTWTVSLFYASLANTLHQFPRFAGEVSSFPPKWELSGNDAWMPLEASGIVRRLNQGRNPNSTGLLEYLLSLNPYTYWPLTDGSSAATGAVYGAYPFYRFRGVDLVSAEFGSGELNSDLSNVLRITNTGDHPGNDGFFYGDSHTPDLTAGGSVALDFVWRAEVLGPLNVGLWTFRTGGEYDVWRLRFRADGANDDVELTVELDTLGASPTTVTLANSAALSEVTDGNVHHCRIQLTDNGTGTDYAVYVDGSSVLSGTRASYDLRNAARVTVNYIPDGVDDTPLSLGHVAFWPSGWTAIPSAVDLAYAVTSYLGEPAGERISRLCSDNGITLQSHGDLADTYAMGRQPGGALLPIIEEAAALDMGLLYEPRDMLGLAYRTRKDLYNQAPRVTLDYAAGELAPPLEPVDDDQRTRNDIFAQRVNGGSYQATLSSGPLSILEPPGGVGRYKDEVPLNVESDDALPELAGWLLMLGTIDEARFPSVTVNMVVLSEEQQAAVLRVSVGDRLVVTNASAANLYDDLSLLVIGYKEDIGPVEHVWQAVCVPYSPYEVLELDDSTSRLSPGEDYHLAADITSAATALSVERNVIEGVEGWTTDAADMPIPIMIGGEEMSLTAVTGTGNPQSFTVTRSVNGVVKAHSAGDVVRLARRARLAL
ncbi:hypothetical protein [Kribbella deserti]|uniref:Uncharacterized protein n=1 Tax=Kribbella deserti TaxID=1926257 RepID=A0ABV6QV85_9ACTN